ncbi:MAG: LuxR C-terminal-related transcriptional regulator [Crocinitomicaceae bacterium]|nr:LuxR C-terminal-related transcriptional regulator [Crocinitomicaceae bacterium]
MRKASKKHLLFTLGFIALIMSSCSRVEPIDVEYNFTASINVSEEIEDYSHVQFEPFDNLDLGFYEGKAWIKLDIKNSSEHSTYIVMTNDLINRSYRFYKLDSISNQLKSISFDSDLSLNDQRTYNDPKPNFQLNLKPNEKAIYVITATSDGRILQATPKLLTIEDYRSISSRNYLFNILFYAAIGTLLLINIFHWSVLKNKIYYYYTFYIFTSCLFYLSVEGLLYGIGLSISAIDHIMFISIRLWILAAILFTAKFLEVNQAKPLFFKWIKRLLIIILGGITIYQFVFYNKSISTLHMAENLIGFFWIMVAFFMIIISFKTRKLQAKYYIIAFSCLLFFITLGLVDSHFTILPGDPFSYFKIGTIIEFTGFTYFILLIIKIQLNKAQLLESELEQRKEDLIKTKMRLESTLKKTDLLSVFKMLENSLSTEEEWDEFKLKLQQLDPDFLERIIKKHSNLTKSELRLVILIRIDYTQKDIAEILSIAPASVKKSRSRVRKKLNLDSGTELKSYLLRL